MPSAPTVSAPPLAPRPTPPPPPLLGGIVVSTLPPFPPTALLRTKFTFDKITFAWGATNNPPPRPPPPPPPAVPLPPSPPRGSVFADRKSTRLNSSHDQISYA